MSTFYQIKDMEALISQINLYRTEFQVSILKIIFNKKKNEKYFAYENLNFFFSKNESLEK